MDWVGHPGGSRDFRDGCDTAEATESPICDAPATPAPEASLAALLKRRAAAQRAGLPDLERELRERIRRALPIRRIAADSGGPAVERLENAQQADSPAPEEEALIEIFAPPPRPGRTKIGQLATLPQIEGRRSERRVLNLAADLRENGGSVAEVEVSNISKHGFLISGASALDLEVGSFAWLKLPGFEPFKSQIVRAAGDKFGGRFLTPLYPAVLQMILREEPKPKQRRLFHPPRTGAAA